MFFFFNDTATTEIYTLSLHDALPIAEPCQRIGETRPVHMELEAARSSHLDDGADLIERVDPAEIGRLGQIDCTGLAAMNLPRRDPGQCLGEAVGADPAVLAADRSELDAAAEEAGGIGLGGIDVRHLAAIDDPPGRPERGQ